MKQPWLIFALLYVVKVKTVTSWQTLDEAFFSWSIDMDEDRHCKLIAHTYEPVNVNRPSLFLKLNDAIEKVNPNISRINLRQLSYQNSDEKDRDPDFEDYSEEFKKDDIGFSYYDDNSDDNTLRTRWQIKACYSACCNALSTACSIYNCKKIKSKFKSYCRKNCKDMFC